MRRKIFKLIWDLSEGLNIPLGRFAPWVFREMIGRPEFTRLK